MENKPSAPDIFGLGPYGEALKLTAEKVLDGVGTILGKICMPVAEEFGLMFKDKIRARRLNNFLKILEKSNGKFNFNADLSDISIHPRILKEIMESGSWYEDDLLQEMWAGLLVSSLEKGEAKGKNILFLDTIKKLTPIQAKIVEFACRNCKVKTYPSGLILGSEVTVAHDKLVEITGEQDVYHLDAELDNLRSNELIGGLGGYDVNRDPLIAQFCPSAFLLQLYAKTQGHAGNLSDFYKKQLADKDDPDFQNDYVQTD